METFKKIFPPQKKRFTSHWPKFGAFLLLVLTQDTEWRKQPLSHHQGTPSWCYQALWEQEHYKPSRWGQQFLQLKEAKRKGGSLQAANQEHVDALPMFKNSFLAINLSWHRDAGSCIQTVMLKSPLKHLLHKLVKPILSSRASCSRESHEWTSHCNEMVWKKSGDLCFFNRLKDINHVI